MQRYNALVSVNSRSFRYTNWPAGLACVHMHLIEGREVSLLKLHDHGRAHACTYTYLLERSTAIRVLRFVRFNFEHPDLFDIDHDHEHIYMMHMIDGAISIEIKFKYLPVG